MGLVVALAGNQTAEVGATIRRRGLLADAVLTSDELGVEKPSQHFFARVVEELGVPAVETLYVGDRLDNDIEPAQEAGLLTAFIRRGPWGFILRDSVIEARCLFRLRDLAELPQLVRQHNVAG